MPLAPWTAADVEAYLVAHVGRAPGTKIQYGHPSPRFWAAERRSLRQSLMARTPGRPLHLYLHIPFCPPTDPDACGFCLFAREDYISQRAVDRYVDDLLVELRCVAALLGRAELDTLYFGGGTPNVLSEGNIRKIFRELHDHFAIPAGCEVSFEGTPALFTEARLQTLAEVGVNRISIGAQTLDPRLVQYSGRQQRPEQVERTLAFCRARDIRSSVDLITGWFEQDAAHVVRDIELLAAWGADAVVNHPLTLGGESAFAHRSHDLPSVDVSCRSFLRGRERLLELGYRADGYTDYCRAELPPVRFLAMYRDALRHDRVGLGYGANCLLAGDPSRPGRTTRNVVGTAPYRERVRALAAGDEGAVADIAFDFEPVDLALLYVLKGLEGTPWLTRAGYAAATGRDLDDDFGPWWQALAKRGWLAWDGDSPRLCGDGVYFTAEVQRCLSEPRNRGLRALPAQR